MEIKPNTVFNQRYSVVRPLPGTPPGGLYLGRDITLEQAVLIKFRQSNGPDSDQMFLRSAAKLKELNHPNLARVVDFFVAEGLQGLVMDYIPGDNLVTFIQQYGALTLPEMEPWVQKLGDALAYLHAQNPPVFHGDIRPANLILTPESELILINYGMPELGMEALSQDQTVFTPPELEDKNNKVSASVDQYGLAATLYYLLTKQSPPSAYQRQVEGAGITPLHTLKNQIPASLHPAVAKALALRPQDRHASITDFYNAFISAGKGSAARMTAQPAVVAAVPIPAVQPSFTPAALPQIPVTQAPPPPPAGKPKKRASALLIIIISVVAVAMLIGGIILMVNLVRTDAIATANDPSTWPTVTPKPVTPTVEIQPTSQPSSSVTGFPNGSIIAYVSDKGDGVTDQIWIMQVDLDENGFPHVLNDMQLTEGGCNKSQLAWDLTGMYLVFVCDTETTEQGKDLFVLDFSSEEVIIEQLTSMPGDEYEPAFSPDGTYLAWGNKGLLASDQAVIYFSEDMATVNEIAQNYGEYSPTFSPDGQTMAYVADDGNGNFVINIAKRSDMYINAQYFDPQLRQGPVAEVEWAPDGEKLAYTRYDPVANAFYIHLTTWTSRGDDDQQLTFSGSDGSPSFSPDSRWIIFTSLRDGNKELYLMAADGTGEEINLTNSPWVEFDPAWMPVRGSGNEASPTNPFGMVGKSFLSDFGDSAGCSDAKSTFGQQETIFICYGHENTPTGTTAYISVYDSSGLRHTSNPFNITGSDMNDWHSISISQDATDTSWAIGSGYIEFYINDSLYEVIPFEIISSTGGGGGE